MRRSRFQSPLIRYAEEAAWAWLVRRGTVRVGAATGARSGTTSWPTGADG